MSDQKTILGLPVVESDALPGGRIVVGPWDDLASLRLPLSAEEWAELNERARRFLGVVNIDPEDVKLADLPRTLTERFTGQGPKPNRRQRRAAKSRRQR